MKRWVYAYRNVSGAPATLEQMLLRHSIDLLQAATGTPEDAPAADGSHVLNLHSTVAGITMAKRVRVTTGVAYRSGPGVSLPLTWHAELGHHVFPTFEGTLVLDALTSGTAQLSLVGSYRAPLGLIGAAADAILLRNVAQSTAEAVVVALAAELVRSVHSDPRPQFLSGPRRGAPLRVGDVMTTDPLCIDEDLPLRSAALLLFHIEISGAPVISATGELVGVISEGDLLAKEAMRSFGLGHRAVEEDRRRDGRTAGEVCTRPAKTTVPDALLTEVARRMLDEDVNRLVVLDEGRVVGIIARHDVLAALLRASADIELAVQRCVADNAGPDVSVSLQWGEVTLNGTTRMRSDAEQLPALLLELDGVIGIDSHVQWEVDDIVPPFVYM